jgi:hypothetical protein
MTETQQPVIPAKRSAERESSSKGGARGRIPAERADALAGMTMTGAL